MQYKHMEIFTGRVGAIEELREFTGGCVLNFSVAETQRIKKGEEWVDGPTLWTRVTIFGDEARNVQRSIKPGTFVTVYGERKAQDYVAKDTNEKRTSQSVLAEQVSIAITKFNFVNELGNVNYSKDGIITLTPAAGDGTPAPKAKQPKAKSEKDPFSETEEPFGEGNDPFGDNDDPFGLA